MAARELEAFAVGDIIQFDTATMLVVRDLTSTDGDLKLVCISKGGPRQDTCAHIYRMTHYPDRWQKVGHFDGL